jgi:ABC-type branched-subunit amino acid transport system substrate-binding protein
LRNFRAAADEVNARGGVLGGTKIEIVPFDNKGSPQETLLVFKQVTDQKIHYVAATISIVALALTDAVAKHNARNPDHPALFLDYDAREPSLTESKCNFWHFRFHPHTDIHAWAVGTPAAIGASGADRIKTLMQWHINDADAGRRKRSLAYRQKCKALQYLDYLPICQTMDMFAAAIERAKRADPVKVALAMEGMEYNGPSGRSWLRAEDHQVMSPIYVLRDVIREGRCAGSQIRHREHRVRLQDRAQGGCGQDRAADGMQDGAAGAVGG